MFFGTSILDVFLADFRGSGDLKIGDFFTFFAFFTMQISKPFFGRQKIRFLKKGFLFWTRWAVRADPVSKA